MGCGTKLSQHVHDELTQKVTLLLDLTVRRRPSFTAWDLFDFDNTTLFLFVNLLTNYVNVIMQFHN